MIALVVAIACVWGLCGLGGCTSDEPGAVGAGIPSELDLDDPTVLKIRTLAINGSLTLSDPDKPFDQFEVLYFGHRGEEASSILARYDFSSLQDSVGQDVVINEANIKSVTLRLFRMKAYESTDTTVAGIEKDFEIWTLSDTLDTSLYPGDEPAVEFLIADEHGVGSAIFIDLPETRFVDWWQNGHTGIMIKEGDGSDEGLVGYASAELELYSQIDLEDDETVVGPTITVTFEDALDVGAQTFAPIADVSTFHAADSQSEDFDGGIMMRTHMRTYPWFRIDLDGLPENILVNRAILRCAVDTSRGYGPLAALVLSEVPIATVEGVDTLTLDEFGDAVALVEGQVNVDPTYIAEDMAPWVGWDVTNSIQRYVNGVVSGGTGLILSDGEDVFSSYDIALWDPEFYLTRYWFFGTAEPEAGEEDMRPYLEITYTTFTGGAR